MFPRLPARATFVADTNFVSGHKTCFWFCSETFCVRSKCFPVCAAQETWATMCPQQCVLVYQGLKRALQSLIYRCPWSHRHKFWRKKDHNHSTVRPIIRRITREGVFSNTCNIWISISYRTKIGVFFCGPAALSHQLHKTANAHSNVAEGVKFYYNKENF